MKQHVIWVAALLCVGCAIDDQSHLSNTEDAGSVVADRGLPETPPTCVPRTLHIDAASDPGGDGTADAPMPTFDEATRALSPVCPGDAIHARSGRYVETVVVAGGLSLRGGFDRDWRPGGAPTEIHAEQADDAHRLVAVWVVDAASPTRLQDLRLSTADAPPGVSTYGVFATHAPGLVIDTLHIEPGAAGPGAPGTPGEPGVPGGPGRDAYLGIGDFCFDRVLGGDGGTNPACPRADGGRGHGDVHGAAESPGLGCDDGDCPVPGQPGRPGRPGTLGPEALTPDGWRGAPGRDGTAGNAGVGAPGEAYPSGAYEVGLAGGGGAAGGCGGGAGGAGTAGAGAFAVYAVNAAGMQILASQLTARQGGQGGPGAMGGLGGAAGSNGRGLRCWGRSGVGDCDGTEYEGCEATAAEPRAALAGGPGGRGGSGSPGPAVALACTGGLVEPDPSSQLVGQTTTMGCCMPADCPAGVWDATLCHCGPPGPPPPICDHYTEPHPLGEQPAHIEQWDPHYTLRAHDELVWATPHLTNVTPIDIYASAGPDEPWRRIGQAEEIGRVVAGPGALILSALNPWRGYETSAILRLTADGTLSMISARWTNAFAPDGADGVAALEAGQLTRYGPDGALLERRPVPGAPRGFEGQLYAWQGDLLVGVTAGGAARLIRLDPEGDPRFDVLLPDVSGPWTVQILGDRAWVSWQLDGVTHVSELNAQGAVGRPVWLGSGPIHAVIHTGLHTAALIGEEGAQRLQFFDAEGPVGQPTPLPNTLSLASTPHGVARVVAVGFGAFAAWGAPCGPDAPVSGLGEVCAAQAHCAPNLVCDGDRCAAPRCGDGVISRSEACDDANDNPNDGCAACRRAPIGIGHACDPQRPPCTYGAYCVDGVCVSHRCGDGVQGPDEACDDGNGDDGDGCTAACEPAPVAVGRACDGALRCADDLACVRQICEAIICGDARVDTGEDCDPGDPEPWCPACQCAYTTDDLPPLPEDWACHQRWRCTAPPPPEACPLRCDIGPEHPDALGPEWRIEIAGDGSTTATQSGVWIDDDGERMQWALTVEYDGQGRPVSLHHSTEGSFGWSACSTMRCDWGADGLNSVSATPREVHCRQAPVFYTDLCLHDANGRLAEIRTLRNDTVYRRELMRWGPDGLTGQLSAQHCEGEALDTCREVSEHTWHTAGGRLLATDVQPVNADGTPARPGRRESAVGCD